MSEIVLKSIRIYPIKACAGIEVEEAQMERRGLRYDRRWMLMNDAGTYYDQLSHPRLACIVPQIHEDGLRLQAPGMPSLRVPFHLEQITPLSVRISRSICEVLPIGKEIDEWFQDFLHVSCRLVFMPETTQRTVNPDYAINQDIVSFASGYPYHLIGEASVAHVNQLLDTPVPLERFRPNLVITGAPAFAEDNWQTIRINQQIFHLVKPCDRCAITNVDQRTGEVAGKEPLRTLARFRTVKQKVLFGQYLLAEEKGLLRVGDLIQVVQSRVPAPTS
ncbi:MOSC domain-containing protein [Dictyobacter aurantiacus]|uniref:MOSC domain-containing protein n=1 Tax=Dictyobacter aurantiacus TaxID=1936993 RepID=A0A401ZAG5_9CHLR|nr:MOSC N-terminal beta barrel domain-containing protein [Dictyobacter aurantiacus]GCE03845.1 MOSC domain-containing protein [Dictyobacter aurantiacus]